MITKTAQSIKEVVTSGLCIGCGLCEAVTAGRVPMKMTDYGSLRPTPADAFTPQEEAQLLSACPGVVAEPRVQTDANADPIWGAYTSMRYAWAGDADLRFRAATGGVLSALGVHLLKSGKAQFILHVGVDPDRPVRNRWIMSETVEDVIANSGSRYSPTAPLAGLMIALERNEPFAMIAKPCDLGAVHRLAQTDPRINKLCIARLIMVCGGQSRHKKSADVLTEYGVTEDEVTLFRYRGYGNPGRTRIETKDGRAFEKTYQELWENEASWGLETRCKLCPDALGEAADISAADVWPGGGPSGEDAGFNGIIVRSPAGEALVESAVKAGDLILGDFITPRQFDTLQPHQVRKKEALSARFSGLTESGFPAISTIGLRLEELGQRLDQDKRQKEIEGTKRRVQEGRIGEPLPAKNSND
ncbi:MAG: coenzyme F420 hydrogenase subunit beta [Cellvibrionaceae bacterium]|jgi:coenzyme F420 hydrogenase subunit beta